MKRARELRATHLRPCIVCGDDVQVALYESWTPAGLLGRRKLDVRWRWECLTCGTRSPATRPVGADNR